MFLCCSSDPGAVDPGDRDNGDSVAVWRVLGNAPDGPNNSQHDDIYFLNESKGWLVNVAGSVYGTQDGGTSWSPLHTRQGTPYTAVGFASDLKGWVGSLNSFNNPQPFISFFETDDGGVTWTNITHHIQGPEPVGICGIHVVDPETIFAVGRWNGPAVFVRSLNGGIVWESFNLSPLATGLVDVHFFNRDEGLIVGGLGVGNLLSDQAVSRTIILSTSDGGETWETAYRSDRHGTWAWKISFPDRETGFVSTQGATEDGVILKTSDGGRSWTEIVVTPGFGFSGIGFATDLTGWVAAHDKVFHTADGGATWQEASIGLGINRFRFLSPSLGYAAGNKVHIYEPE